MHQPPNVLRTESAVNFVFPSGRHFLHFQYEWFDSELVVAFFLIVVVRPDMTVVVQAVPNGETEEENEKRLADIRGSLENGYLRDWKPSSTFLSRSGTGKIPLAESA